MVLLEAGACGVPAVATDVAGTQEIVTNGVNGWLSHTSDADALAAGMEKLMQMTPEQRCAMGERARRLVAERCGLDLVLDRWEQIYAKLLARKGDRTARLAARETLMRHRLISEQMRSAKVKVVGGYSTSSRSIEVN